jgi:hypothetical protein
MTVFVYVNTNKQVGDKDTRHRVSRIALLANAEQRGDTLMPQSVSEQR